MASLLVFASSGLSGASEAFPVVILRTEHASFTVDATGSLCGLQRNRGNRSYLAPGQPAPVLRVRADGQFHVPQKARWEPKGNRLTLDFPSGDFTAVVRAEEKQTHVVFELVDLQPPAGVELVLWGPYPTSIGAIIGEVVGVVRDAEFAVGLQALNARTLGGYPTAENDVEVQFLEDDPTSYSNLPPELCKGQLYRGDTARRTYFGSVLQAFVRNRNRDRTVANWGYEEYLAPAFKDPGVIGSRIALFGCPVGKALDTLGAIEIAEGLPHPMLDGVWGKVATNANCSYLIADFGESNLDQAIEITTRAGLNYLYHSSLFDGWGHFNLRSVLFPNGRAGLKDCVEKARRAGVRIGFHTLSNFITPNDPYVTPEPDSRLARVGTSTLTTNIDETQTELPISSPVPFRKRTLMSAVAIGTELIRYGAVSTTEPWRLLDCQRGAWGTQPRAHAAGDAAAKLADDDFYGVFLTDADLSQEIAGRIAELCNQLGTMQLSLDGLEGNSSTGMGQYGRALFTKAWFDALSPELRGQINDASTTGHFTWHIFARMNWGEPWYAGFRESQTRERLKNQVFFERNLMPHMLGWWLVRPDTSVEDAEWLLARAAGFDAGFALVCNLPDYPQGGDNSHSAGSAPTSGAMPAILDRVKSWESARMAGAFPPELKAALRDTTREFHLNSCDCGQWELSERHLERLTIDAGTTTTNFTFENGYHDQSLQWIMRASPEASLTGMIIEINGKMAAELLDCTVPPAGCFKYGGGTKATIYDTAWRELARVPVDASAAWITTGSQEVKITCSKPNTGGLPIEFWTLGTPTRIGVPACFAQISTLENQRLEVSWCAVPGHVYQLQENAGIDPAGWSNLGVPVTATNRLVRVYRELTSDPQRFYRVLEVP